MPALLDTRLPPARAGGGKTDGKCAEATAAPAPPARDRFIPVSRYGLRAKLLAQLAEGGGDERAFGRALDCLAAWRHQAYRKRLLDLIEDYLPFSPDSDTATLIELDEAGRAKARAEFIEGVERLLVQANYVRLSQEDLQRILIERSPHGLSLKVDLSDFDDLLLYYRGTAVEVQEERNPWRLYLTKDRCEVPIFQRLFLLLKLKPAEQRGAEIAAATGIDQARAVRIARKRREHLPTGVSSGKIYVKVFKRIPQVDLEMLFPNTRIAFRPFDKLKLCVTAGGGTAAGVAGTATKLLAATNPITLAIALAGLSAVIFRQVMGFFNTRNRYMMVLAQNLYFCSLANNHGALTLIADSAEEEDVKEDMLLYAFLARARSHYDALPGVREDISRFLKERCGASVSYDAEDALRRLQEDGLVRAAPDGTLIAVAPEEARAHLDLLWDRLLDVDTLDRAASSSTA
jgi:Protein of unknown function (DUF3754)